jgi:hypothetical protein
MSRTIQDHDLREWEVFASAANSGFADTSQIIFNCLSDRHLRPRVVELDDDVAQAEKRVAEGSQTELQELLERAHRYD